MKALKEAIYSGHKVSIPVDGDGNSIKVKNMHKILNGIFGGHNGSYFTHAESLIEKDGHKFNVILVEDEKENKFQIWFDFGPVK